MSLNKELLHKKFGRNIKDNEILSKYSWFNLGGPAEIFFKTENKSQLIEFIKVVIKEEYSFKILGAGSNTLIRDLGIKGIVIKLGKNFAEIKLLEKDTIEVGAAALDKSVSEFAKNNNIANMEFLSCIPGSIGGAITMNSGCYGSDISDLLQTIKILDQKGNEKEIKKEEIKFYYRGTNLPENFIILSATLKGSISSKNLIEKKQRELIEKKKESQPSQIKTCGSTFKNNGEKKAWQLIKDAGCSNFVVGDAVISEKHCNFFVNKGNAKAHEIEMLIKNVKKEVKKKSGIDLELEIKIIGDEK